MKQINKTDDFTIIEVASGVYAVITEFMLAHGYCNSAIIDLGDKCLVFDTLGHPKTAKQLIQEAHELTGQKIVYLINSHWHWDHVWGNQSFEHAIFSTIKTREVMQDNQQEQLDSFKTSLPHYLEHGREQLEEGINGDSLFGFPYDTTEHFKRHLQSIQYLNDGLDDIDLRLPDFTFETRMQIWGSTRHVELRAFHGLHSASDLIMYIPDVKVLVGGDLVVSDILPFAYGEQPLKYAAIFKQLQAMEIEHIIPGHGTVADPEVLSILQNYWELCHAAAKQAAQADDLESYLSTLKRPQNIPARFQGTDKTFQAAVRRFATYGILSNE